jgi:hypothetical protein
MKRLAYSVFPLHGMKRVPSALVGWITDQALIIHVLFTKGQVVEAARGLPPVQNLSVLQQAGVSTLPEQSDQESLEIHGYMPSWIMGMVLGCGNLFGVSLSTIVSLKPWVLMFETPRMEMAVQNQASNLTPQFMLIALNPAGREEVRVGFSRDQARAELARVKTWAPAQLHNQWLDDVQTSILPETSDTKMIDVRGEAAGFIYRIAAAYFKETS